MPSLGHATFDGKSGQAYRFRVYPWGAKLRPLSGLYIVANRCRDGAGKYQHIPLYVGETEDLSQPLQQHHKAAELERQDANSICLQSDGSEESRVRKQQDLVTALRPVCND